MCFVSDSSSLTVLCLASYHKGDEFLRECRRLGCRVILVTLDTLAEADWPRDSIDEFYHMPDLGSREDIVHAVSYLARTRQIDRIVALDDYDVETAALLREHLRVPGMGDTTARYFRDKLAMRVKAREHGILVPEFVHALNDGAVSDYIGRVAPPWVLKPRSEAAAIGIKKVRTSDEIWPLLDALGDRRSYYVLEQFVPGDIFHIDAIVSEREVVFAVAHKYGEPPMAVAHEGGIFTTQTLARDSVDAQALESLNRELIATLGLVRGVTHTEFIKGDADGRFYFLETAARVGGANIAEAVEAATGVNLWHEWARIEVKPGDAPYHVPPHRNDYAGIVISLARQERPDTSAFSDPEVVWRLEKDYHIGLIVASERPERVAELIDGYQRRILAEFHAVQPLPDKPTA